MVMNAADNSNPLLDFSGLPRLDAIRAQHVAPAVDLLVGGARIARDAVASDAAPALGTPSPNRSPMRSIG